MYKTILIPVSGKNGLDRAKSALNHAKNLACGDIVLLHIFEPLPQIVGGEAHAELLAEQKAKGQTLLNTVAAEMENPPGLFAAAWKKAPRLKPSFAWRMRKMQTLSSCSLTDATGCKTCCSAPSQSVCCAIPTRRCWPYAARHRAICAG